MHGRGELCSSLGMDPKTVRKYTAPALAAGICPGGPPLSVEEWSALVEEWFPELVDRSLRQKTWPEIEDLPRRRDAPGGPRQPEDHELVTERANKASIFTANRQVERLVLAFPNPVVAESVLDRIVNAAHHVHMDGRSYRPNKRPAVKEAKPR